MRLDATMEYGIVGSSCFSSWSLLMRTSHAAKRKSSDLGQMWPGWSTALHSHLGCVHVVAMDGLPTARLSATWKWLLWWYCKAKGLRSTASCVGLKAKGFPADVSYGSLVHSWHRFEVHNDWHYVPMLLLAGMFAGHIWLPGRSDWATMSHGGWCLDISHMRIRVHSKFLLCHFW